MITAILNQRVRRRQRRLADAFNESLEELMTSEQPLLSDELHPQPEDDKAEGKKKNHHWVRYGLLIVLVIVSSLLLLAFKTDVFPWPGHRNPEYSIELGADPFFEEMLFNYVMSDDVRLMDDLPDSIAGEGIVTGLQVSWHTVKKGESISAIAKRYQLNLDTIISYNNIQNAKTLKTGQRLGIPSINGIKYRVKRGDSLSAIASRFRIALNSLLDWNNITSPTIFPGTEYFVPEARMSKNDLNRVLGTLFIYPVRGRLTSKFGWRKDPINGSRQFHNGIDLAGATNTSIKAAMDGQVVKTSFNRVFGHYIIIKHSDGFQTLYGHLNKIIVADKQKVQQGQKVGYMGNSGYSTGTHLHFTIFKNGEPVDPFLYLD